MTTETIEFICVGWDEESLCLRVIGNFIGDTLGGLKEGDIPPRLGVELIETTII